MMQMIWKTIEDYPDYEVSDAGKVRNKNTHKVLKYRRSAQGYDRVRLYKDKIGKNMLVHRLVATAFIPNEERFPVVNHKDEDVTNNNVSNLEWCSTGYNNTYGSAQIKRSKSNSKRVCQYDVDGKLIRVFDSLKEASAILHLQESHISRCCNGLRKRTGGFMWSFAKGGDYIAST